MIDASNKEKKEQIESAKTNTNQPIAQEETGQLSNPKVEDFKQNNKSYNEEQHSTLEKQQQLINYMKEQREAFIINNPDLHKKMIEDLKNSAPSEREIEMYEYFKNHLLQRK